ncbi:hypothetical protein MJO46_12245 [Shewanella sp. KJ2020]|nr:MULTISPECIES: hypothetical protein [unclassified Shewanella]MCP3129060.1 hypothetical protein [Shewanella sp. KJ2020]
MKFALSQLSAEGLNQAVRFSNFSMPNLALLFGLLFVLPAADLVSVMVGGCIDIGELITLSDGFLIEFFGATLLSVLLLNPQIIKQLWNLFDNGFKFSNNLNLANANPLLAPPRLKSLEHLAHGCRAPPL